MTSLGRPSLFSSSLTVILILSNVSVSRVYVHCRLSSRISTSRLTLLVNITTLCIGHLLRITLVQVLVVHVVGGLVHGGQVLRAVVGQGCRRHCCLLLLFDLGWSGLGSTA